MLRVEHAHESEPRGTIEHARVEEDRRDRDFTLELLQQRERAIEREDCPDPDE